MSRFCVCGQRHRRETVAADRWQSGLRAGRCADLARSTSRCICSTSASTDSKRRSPRIRSRKAMRSFCAVEVAVEVDQVGLDQQAAAGLEGRPDADVHAAGWPCAQARTRRARAHECGRRARGSRSASRARAARSPHHHLALEQERAAQELRGLHVAGRDEPRMWLNLNEPCRVRPEASGRASGSPLHKRGFVVEIVESDRNQRGTEEKPHNKRGAPAELSQLRACSMSTTSA